MDSGLSNAQALGIGLGAGFLAALWLLFLAALSVAWNNSAKSVLLKALKIENANPETLSSAETPLVTSLPDTAGYAKFHTLPEGVVIVSCKQLHKEIRATSFQIETLIYNAFIPACQVGSTPVLQPVSPSIFNENGLIALAGNPANGGTWSESIANPQTRQPALQCFVAQVLVKRMVPECPLDESLLPLEVATCYQYLLKPLGVRDEERYRAVWRGDTFLCTRSRYIAAGRPLPIFPEGDPREERVKSLTSKVMEALNVDSIILPGKLEGAKNELAHVFRSGGNLAYLLFGQHGTLEVLWPKGKGFIVFPELRLVAEGQVVTSAEAIDEDA